MYGGGGQWPGQQPQQTGGGYMQPQMTGYMGMQPQRPMMTGMPPQQQQQQQQTGFLSAQQTGMGMGMGMGGMMPQATGMGGMGMGQPGGPGLGGMRQASYGQPTGMMGGGSALGQQRFMSPQGVQPTGMMQSNSPRPQFGGGLQPQATGYPGGPMGMQPTGLMPQMTGLPLDPRMQLMSAQFLPGSTPFSGAPMAGNMNFSNAQMQPASFQSSIQNLSQQQQGSKEPKIPWALSKDERKSYDSIFRAWDQKGTGFLNGEVAIEVFGQSGLERDKLMQIWHLSDTENRGKLNLAEFHVAMGLIYRALNGNDIPEHLPQELVPPSAKDLSDSVDFLKDLLKRDANVRQTTALNLPETGSNSGVNYGKTRSFHENPIQKQDATAYKHTDEASTGYKSSARHLDRKTVRYGGESPADDLTEMKRQLAQTQRMLDSQADRDDEDDREVEREMEELRFRIKRVQDDIDYYNRRGGRDATDNRRKAERELLHLMHERLPLLEKRLDEKDKKKREKNVSESRDRDRRNESSLRGGRYSDYDDNSRSQTPTQRDHARNGRSARESYDDNRTESDRPPPPTPPPVAEISKPAPPPPASPSVAAVSAPAPPPSSGPPKSMTPEQKKEWVRAEAQRRVAERMRSLGLSVPSTTSPAPDSSVEDRLAADRAEAQARTAQADAEATAREEARRARLEEQKLEKEKAALSTVKSELKEQEKSENPPPQFIQQAAKEQVNEEEEMLRRREEVLKKEKEERLARFKKLEEEEAEAKRQEEAFKQRQAQFSAPASSPSSSLPAPVRKGKSGPPPPPPNRSRAAPTPAVPAAAAPAPAPPPAPPAPTSATAAQTSPTAPISSTPSGNASTNPFFRMQSQTNGAAVSPATPGGTNPFYRQQQPIEASKSAFADNLPAPQRSAGSASAAPVAPTNITSAPSAPRRAPDEDDDWGESEHGDHEDEDPDGPGSTSRATRQNLAAALFSNLVSTPPQSASPAPQAPAPPTTTSTEGAPPPPPPAPPVAPSAPAAPPAAIAKISPPSGGAADRGALLGQIRGGLSLRKSQTNDRSAAGFSGKVIGDASAPVQTYVPPPSPPQEEVGDSTIDTIQHNPNRQSVDWAGSLAADQMHSHQKASALPDEPSLQEEQEESDDEKEGPEDLDGPKFAGNQVNGSASVAAAASDEANDFDLSKSIRVRTLYPYEAQGTEDLEFIENSVIVAHPAKDESSDWWYGSVVNETGGKKGIFPRAYVQSIEQPKIAKALYDFEGSSPEEMNLTAEQELHVVDDQDESWWKVIDKQDRILIVPATYVELIDGTTVIPKVKDNEQQQTELPNGTTQHKQIDTNSSKNLTLTEEEALAKAMKQSERDERERHVAQSREEKDLQRAIILSKESAQGKSDVNEEEEDEGSEDDSDYSTTGWTSSEDDDDDISIEREQDQSEEAQQRRVAERLRVLEAAGILIVQGHGKDYQGITGEKIEEDVNANASKQAEDLLLHRRPTAKRSKPERPTRTIGEQRKRKERPGKPSRPPPPPPIEKEPEVQMDDAYERFVKLSKQVQEQQQQKNVSLPSLPTSPNASITDVGSSSSPPPTLASTKSSAGSGLLNTLKNMSSRKTGTQSPANVERKSTPIISGPMMVQRNQSPAIGSQQRGSISDGENITTAAAAAASTTSWSSVIGSEALNAIPEQERKRQEAIFELIATESSHVRDVQIIVDVFFNAMQPLLQSKAATVIFGNIEEILLASVSLLSDLEARQRFAQMFITQIGDILENHMKQMSVYIPYCVNQESATNILNTERKRNIQLDELLKKLRNEHASARGLDLSHFLLVPMQRLTRYPLLIGQILRYTNEEDADPQEYKSLRNAMTNAQSLLDTTNESIRQRQSDERLIELTEKINASSAGQNGTSQVKLDLTQKTRWMGQRRILREEILIKQKSGRRISVILCNDLVILLSGRRTMDGNTNVDQYLYRMPMPLEELIVRDVPSGITGRDDLSFQLLHQGREKVNIRCTSARACHSWMHSIDSARSDCLAAANKINRRSSKQI